MSFRRYPHGWRAIFVTSVLLVVVACRQEGSSSAVSGGADAPADARAAESVIVSAAASTKEAMEELAERFERQRGAKVHVNLASSSALAAQITSGAPADLFLSASPEWAAVVADAGLVDEQWPFIVNTLIIVTPKGNPANVHSPQDLGKKSLELVALAGETVPAGRYADQALRSVNLLEPLVAKGKIVRGQDVRVALSYVERGEAEAGIVYATDAKASNNVEVVYTFEPHAHDPIVYVLAKLKHGQQNRAAAQFAEFLMSPQADAAFTRRGFQRPDPDALPVGLVD